MVSWGNISWHLIPVTFLLLTPNSSGTHVEGCWMSKKDCCLPLEPLGRSRKKRMDWAQCSFFSTSSGISIKLLQMYNWMWKEGWFKNVVEVKSRKMKSIWGKRKRAPLQTQMNMTLLYFVKRYFWFFIISSKYTARVLTGEEIYHGKV